MKNSKITSAEFCQILAIVLLAIVLGITIVEIFNRI